MNSEIFKKPLPYLALLLAHVIWGANFVISKVALQEIPVMSLGFLRFGLACLLIAPFLIPLESKHKKIRLEHIPKLFLISMLLVTFNITLFYFGLKETTAINASAISLSVPIISLLIGWWFLRERIFFINLMGILLGLSGGLIILGVPLVFIVPNQSALPASFNGINYFGNYLILGSAICSVFGMILSKQMLKIYSPLVLTATVFLFGALAFFIPAVFEYLKNPGWVNQVSVLGILGLIYIVVLSSICAYFLLIWGLTKVDVTHANLFQNIEPAIAATLAIPLLGERISFSFIIATCLIVLGVYWATLGKPEHHHTHLKHHRN